MSSHTNPSTPPTRPAAARNLKAEQAARRAKLAPLISWLILLFGVGVLVVFLYQAGLFAFFSQKTAPVTPPPVALPEQVSGQSSRLSGFDNLRLPFEITAQRGHQDKSNHDIVHLEEMTSKFRKANGETYDVSAKSGTYNTRSREMQLAGDVTIFSPNRYSATMDKADINTLEKTVQSQSPVVIELSSGQITANGLQITDDGHRILLTNGVKARFNSATKKGVDGQ